MGWVYFRCSNFISSRKKEKFIHSDTLVYAKLSQRLSKKIECSSKKLIKKEF